MIKTQFIADKLGRACMADALNVGPTMISKAVVQGKFPPSWFIVMKSLCDDADIECPPSLFGMKSTISQLGGDASTPLQGVRGEKVNEASA